MSMHEGFWIHEVRSDGFLVVVGKIVLKITFLPGILFSIQLNFLFLRNYL